MQTTSHRGASKQTGEQEDGESVCEREKLRVFVLLRLTTTVTSGCRKPHQGLNRSCWTAKFIRDLGRRGGGGGGGGGGSDLLHWFRSHLPLPYISLFLSPLTLKREQGQRINASATESDSKDSSLLPATVNFPSKFSSNAQNFQPLPLCKY